VVGTSVCSWQHGSLATIHGVYHYVNGISGRSWDLDGCGRTNGPANLHHGIILLKKSFFVLHDYYFSQTMSTVPIELFEFVLQ
jgi:hypothetical protein